MTALKVGDPVRVLDRHGNTLLSGTIVGFANKDRSHVSNKVVGRVLGVVELEGGAEIKVPLALLRTRENEQTH